MFYVNIEATETGYHGNPQTQNLGGMIALPDKFIKTYIQARGFVDLDIQNYVVVNVTPNQANLDAYLRAHPDKPKPKTQSERVQDLEETNKSLKDQVLALSSQNEFYEELIVELASVVYA